jgi:hypothetical protein
LLSISAGANARYALFADFTKAIEINPRHAEAFLRRGTVYGVNGERDRAIVEYGSAIDRRLYEVLGEGSRVAVRMLQDWT